MPWLKLTVAAKSELRVSRRCQASSEFSRFTCGDHLHFPASPVVYLSSCTPTLNMPSCRLDTQAWRSQVLSFLQPDSEAQQCIKQLRYDRKSFGAWKFHDNGTMTGPTLGAQRMHRGCLHSVARTSQA
jgi:hypothetical protein